MKKIKIVGIIILLLIIVGITFGLYILFQFEKYTGIIVSIGNDNIIVKSTNSKIKENAIDEEIGLKYYSFSTEGVLVKKYDGHKIESSELKVGDIIDIFKIKEKLKKDILYSVEPLYNVKMVKVVEKNK